MRLTPLSHWDSVHQGSGARPEPPPSKRGFRFLRALLGDRVDDYALPYAEYILWKVLYPRWIPSLKGLSAFEVGCAPGHHLVRMHEELGADPSGIDYSPVGVEVCRQVFRDHGLDPGRILQGDFFGGDFAAAHAGKHDVVFSHGFIEHFDDPADVVRRHALLVRPGGHLIISIPNIRGINHLLTVLFNRPLLKVHNLRIMRRDRFGRLFEGLGLDTLFCDYFGTFNSGLFYTPAGSRLQPVLGLMNRVQLRLNILLRLLTGHRGLDGRFWSPYLLFIGRKPVSGERP